MRSNIRLTVPSLAARMIRHQKAKRSPQPVRNDAINGWRPNSGRFFLQAWTLPNNAITSVFASRFAAS